MKNNLKLVGNVWFKVLGKEDSKNNLQVQDNMASIFGKIAAFYKERVNLI